MKRILVTTAGGGVGNNLIRGLLRSRKYALEIIGTNIDKFYLARSLAHKNYLVPRADAGDAYIEAIRRIVDDEHIDLIIVGNDAEVGPVSKYRDRFGAKVLLPSPETIERCQDKLTLNAHLAGQGIPVAETHPVTTIDEMDSVFQHFAGDDLVWCRMRQGSASKGSLPVKTLEQARAWVSYWRDMRGVPPEMFLLCEYLPGRDYAFQSLWHNGELVLAKTCERLSYLVGEWMPSGTTSTPRVGRLVNDDRVNELCTRAVQSIDERATGMFCIDLKENRDGVPCITEINIGRFFMISPIFNFVGKYNMAELYLDVAFGEQVHIPQSERFGDIGEEETLLVRELDHEPAVLTAAEVEKRFISLV